MVPRPGFPRATLALILVATAACGGDRREGATPSDTVLASGPPADTAARAAAATDTSSRRVAAIEPTGVERIRLRARPDLVENSGAAMSRTQPGVLFTINDSGNDPMLFALDTTGADRGAWRVQRATNVDWESIAVGPCDSREAGVECIYIGDTGDNVELLREHTIYRVSEPVAGRPGSEGRVRAEALRYRYDDGPHDVEAMYVAPDGAMFLMTKRPRADGDGKLRPAFVFRIPATAWQSSGVATANRVDSVPIVPGTAIGRLITDAALAPDGRHLAVRTYAEVYVFSSDSSGGRIDDAIAPTVCNVFPLGERQGEGITWVDASGRLLLTSEGTGVPMIVLSCPLPAAR